MKHEAEIIRHLLNNEIVVLPTDTVYGLVGLASSPIAVERLYAVKGRYGKPGTIIAASTSQLEYFGFNPHDIVCGKMYWPGPFSVILPASQKLAYLHMGLNSLAVRIPGNPELVSLLNKTGPLATTSANRPGKPTVQTINDAKKIFGESVSLYVDGGFMHRKASTILRIVNGKAIRLR